ncbi:MAG: dihydrofolate reductase family protein [Rhizomicrobium sp.]|jgi:dihydrofolate reductase
MGKLIVTEFITADGVIEAPGPSHDFKYAGWSMNFWNAQIQAFKLGEMRDTGALLLGRVTYDGFAAAWPGRSDADGFADRINAVPKYVASSTLKNPAWNNSRVLGPDLAGEIDALKKRSDSAIVVHGSGKFANALLRHDLVDELSFLVYPVVLGEGQRFFESGTHVALDTLETRDMGSGVSLLRYAPKKG